jgi:hypothetical protein
LKYFPGELAKKVQISYYTFVKNTAEILNRKSVVGTNQKQWLIGEVVPDWLIQKFILSEISLDSTELSLDLKEERRAEIPYKTYIGHFSRDPMLLSTFYIITVISQCT